METRVTVCQAQGGLKKCSWRISFPDRFFFCLFLSFFLGNFDIAFDKFLHFIELKDRNVHSFLSWDFIKKVVISWSLHIQHMVWFTYFMLCLSIMVLLSEYTQFMRAALWKLPSVYSSGSVHPYSDVKKKYCAREKNLRKSDSKDGIPPPIHA